MDKYHVLKEVGEAQNGVVTRSQLIDNGLSRRNIETLLQHRLITRYSGGVYRVAFSKNTWLHRASLAVVSCGPNALLSHESVLRLYDILDFSKDGYYRKRRPDYTRHLIHVVNPRVDKRSEEVFFHRSKVIFNIDQNNLYLGIPHVSLERSIIDCNQQLTNHELSYTIERALQLSLATLDRFKTALNALHSGPGREKERITRLVYELSGEDLKNYTESYLEKRVENVIKKSSKFELIRQFEVNVEGRNFRLDFAIPELKIAIEVDGHQFHGHRDAFDSDKMRDSLLTIAGWRILHITARMSDQEILELFLSLQSTVNPT